MDENDWKNKIVDTKKIIEKIHPGMKIFLGTGAAEPRTLIKAIVSSEERNLRDLEFIQLLSLGDAIPPDEKQAQKYRLKTFFSGYVASDAIQEGRVDLIPSTQSRTPFLISSGIIDIDAAFVQITPPDERGFCSLGVAIDAARHAMERAQLVVGEINDEIPYTMGDTFAHINDFHYLVNSTYPPHYFPRWTVADVFEKLARNVASMVEDGSCIAFTFGPLFEALVGPLSRKKDLSVHSVIMTDALMELIKSGAVTNKKKRFFRNKSVTCYAQGTRELYQWLDRNPLIEFQAINIVVNPAILAENEKYIKILPARKVDLHGIVALQVGRSNVTLDPGEVHEVFYGAELSPGGRTIFALPSRNREGESNIILSALDQPNQFTNSESLDLIVTEFGIASMRGRTRRERALALIDIAHPDDRGNLVEQAKNSNILYTDQIYLTDSGHCYPYDIAYRHMIKEGQNILFRAIKPSDEDEMRRLFYRFSDQAVYYRYFTPIKTMPHMKMQEYVNIDYQNTMSIVGVVEEKGAERIVAEGRYVVTADSPYADAAFIVDEKYQGLGIAKQLFELLITTAKKRGIAGFTADVLTENKPMLKVFESSRYPVHAVVSSGVYELTIPFTEDKKTQPVVH
ncbi:MAG: GNAT family N-acetyltransferase [Syntrophales bacterium]|jgi:acyl-CoA hydrolase/GNAT superfamily N-acetyltransferase|nr:GNAT family N-acetyltransferase [Syntrophales bacterium]MDY0044379.1 GNAT family N-acetyltransferase [Syntrophales bacterium]